MRSSSSSPNHNLWDNLMVPLTLIVHQKLRIWVLYRNSLGYLSKHGIVAINTCHVHLEIRPITCMLLHHVSIQCSLPLSDAGLVFLTSTLPRVWWFAFVMVVQLHFSTVHSGPYTVVPQADIWSYADFLLLLGFKLPTQVLRPYKPQKPLEMTKTGEK